MALRINADLQSQLVNMLTGTMGTCVLDVYGGTQPAAGGGASTNAVLVSISGIVWGSAATAGTVGLVSTYTGTAASSGTLGTAVWARLSDAAASAFVIDGACGTSSLSEFVMDDEVIVGGEVYTLTNADIVMPAS